MSKNISHWHILGAGAIGSVMASYLQAAQHEVTMLIRSPAYLAANQIILIEAHQATYYPVAVQLSSEYQQTINHLLVCTKIYDVLSALKSVKHLLAPHANIVICCNGLGIEDELIEQFNAFSLWRMLTNYGAYTEKPLTVKLVGYGRCQLGKINETSAEPNLLDHFKATPLNMNYSENILITALQKVIINACINPITAIYQCCNGELLSNDHLFHLVKTLAHETIPVAQQHRYLVKFGDIMEKIIDTLTVTRDNFSSTLQDIKHQRKTELAYINGYLVAQAKKMEIRLPLHESMLHIFEQFI